jgi:hypothetical protein
LVDPATGKVCVVFVPFFFSLGFLVFTFLRDAVFSSFFSFRAVRAFKDAEIGYGVDQILTRSLLSSLLQQQQQQEQEFSEESASVWCGIGILIHFDGDDAVFEFDVCTDLSVLLCSFRSVGWVLSFVPIGILQFLLFVFTFLLECAHKGPPS